MGIINWAKKTYRKIDANLGGYLPGGVSPTPSYSVKIPTSAERDKGYRYIPSPTGKGQTLVTSSGTPVIGRGGGGSSSGGSSSNRFTKTIEQAKQEGQAKLDIIAPKYQQPSSSRIQPSQGDKIRSATNNTNLLNKQNLYTQERTDTSDNYFSTSPNIVYSGGYGYSVRPEDRTSFINSMQEPTGSISGGEVQPVAGGFFRNIFSSFTRTSTDPNSNRAVDIISTTASETKDAIVKGLGWYKSNVVEPTSNVLVSGKD